MARSKWKLNYFSYEILKHIYKQKITFSNTILQKNKKIFIFSKMSRIPSFFNDQFIHIYKGKSFRKLKINKYNCGYRFGNFVMTRKPFSYPIKQKKK